MNSRPIGMFDSGVGGLTVLKEVIKQCPNEKIIYLGDTKRFPYGSKSEETIIDLTKKGIDFLISKNVKAVVIACGTATSQALEEVQKCYDIPIIGIINAAVRYIKNKEYKDILSDVSKEKDALREKYAIYEGNVEDEELNLLRKANNPQTALNMSKEEREKVAEINDRGLT